MNEFLKVALTACIPCGKPLLPIDSAQLEQWVTAGLTSAAAIWAWWENNSFTKEALAADSYLEQLKKGVH